MIIRSEKHTINLNKTKRTQKKKKDFDMIQEIEEYVQTFK